jgi:hypothetical protein
MFFMQGPGRVWDADHSVKPDTVRCQAEQKIASLKQMSLRSKLFWLWCVTALIFWSAGDASRVALKYQVGGWRAAYVHFFISLGLASVVALVPVLISLMGLWIASQVRGRDGSCTNLKNEL